LRKIADIWAGIFGVFIVIPGAGWKGEKFERILRLAIQEHEKISIRKSSEQALPPPCGPHYGCYHRKP